ncbi:MAG: T9SS type A sorting domain-containing protein [Bacteroidetes bacterium]|nr:T9SS type A sorting domain-containing protein [Bacteroidota bacterium]
MRSDYTKDTLVNGNNCQMITRYLYRNCINGTFSNTITPIYTYTASNGIVYMNDYTSSDPLQSQSFDTLFWFNAPIGAQWHILPATYTNCPGPDKPKVVVLDTGSRMVQGVHLRWQKVKCFFQYELQASIMQDTIYERLGYLKFNAFNEYTICSPIADLEVFLNFRCYGDNQITDLKYGHNNNCDYVTGLKEASGLSLGGSVYPNPADQKLNIALTEMSGQNGVIRIFDFTGRQLFYSPYVDELDISMLNKGLYRIEVRFDDRPVSRFTFVKSD